MPRYHNGCQDTRRDGRSAEIDRSGGKTRNLCAANFRRRSACTGCVIPNKPPQAPFLGNSRSLKVRICGSLPGLLLCNHVLLVDSVFLLLDDDNYSSTAPALLGDFNIRKCLPFAFNWKKTASIFRYSEP